MPARRMIMPHKGLRPPALATKRASLARFIAGALLMTVLPLAANAHTRTPVCAGRFYPADGEQLARTVDRLTQAAAADRPAKQPQGTLKAIILTHAGYIYSGYTAAHAADVLIAHAVTVMASVGFA